MNSCSLTNAVKPSLVYVNLKTRQVKEVGDSVVDPNADSQHHRECADNKAALGIFSFFYKQNISHKNHTKHSAYMGFNILN